MAKPKIIKSNYNTRNINSTASLNKDNAGRPSKDKKRYVQSNTVYTQPHFYSPLHTPQNWQVPSRRSEIYQWARYFFENEPKVAAAIQFYSEFPMQGFELQCSNSKIKKYFERLNKKLKLDYWLPLISSEYYMLGDVFPFLGISCPQCGGTGILDGKTCSHKGGVFNKLIVLNPDWIEVKQNALADEPFIQLLPNDELRRIVSEKYPLEIYNRIPEYFRVMISSGQPIPLSNRSVKHLKHMPAPYGTYGTSMIRRLFKTLAYKDRLMTANWIVAERLILPVRIVKIGNDDRPAGPTDIANVQQQLAHVQNDPNLTLVTHHAFDYQFAGAQGSIVQLQSEYEMITKEILDGLMLPQAILNSEMAGYQGVQIGAEILITRLENWRKKLSRYIEEDIYMPVAKMQGFIDEEESKEAGETVYIYPTIKWEDLNIRDDTQKKQQYLGLHDAGILSTQTLTEMFDLDYDQEIERRREEANIQMSLGGGMMPGAAGMGGMGGGMPMGGGGGMPPPPMGGDMPMGDMGGGDMGGGDMGGGMPAAASADKNAGKIVKRKHKNRIEKKSEEMQQGQMPYSNQAIQLTKLFNDQGANIPFKKFAQYKVSNPQGQPFVLDFAIPDLKIAIEADGELHKIPENKERDIKRDQKLSRRGWVILRFGENEIKEKVDIVMGEILKYVGLRANELKRKSARSKKVNLTAEIEDMLSSIE
jgi:very-short-patch-repair endonuclease